MSAELQQRYVAIAWIACVLSGCAGGAGGGRAVDAGATRDGGLPPVFHTPDAGCTAMRTGCDAAVACTLNLHCRWPQACIDGACALSATCNHASIDGPIVCLDWSALSALGTAATQHPRLELRVDGGLSALGDATEHRCPEVGELFVNVGGEATGNQPICGPNPYLSDGSDAGVDTARCCYGTTAVAGP